MADAEGPVAEGPVAEGPVWQRVRAAVEQVLEPLVQMVEGPGAGPPERLGGDPPPPPPELAARLAVLYERYCYDLLADMAQAVALDAARSPLKYRSADNLRRFYDARTTVGSIADRMNPAQRAELYGAVFAVHPIGGARGAATAFDVLSAAVRQAASDITAAVYDRSVEALFSVLVSQSTEFTVGAVLPWRIPVLDTMVQIAEANMESAVNILTDPGVARAFGKDQIAARDWPLVTDPAGAELIGEISMKLGDGGRVISGADFVKLQRVARAGRQAIDAIGALPEQLGDPLADDPDVRGLLAAVVSWHRALERLQTDMMPVG